MGVLFANYTRTTIAAPVAAGDLTIVVTGNSTFPTPAAGVTFFYATLVDAASALSGVVPPLKREIVKVTGFTGTTWTVTRAQDSTAATTWAIGDAVELRLNAAALQTLVTSSLYYNVKDYGAIGNGITDDTAAIQAAIDAAKDSVTPGTVFFPAGPGIGGYIISSSLNLNNNVRLLGVGWNGLIGSRLVMTANSPMFNVTAKVTIEALVCLGSSNGAFTNQDCVHVTSLNNVTIERCSFSGFYNTIRYTNICFYCRIVDCEFFDNVNAHVLTDGTGNPGVDVQIYGCRFLPGTGKYGLFFDNLGSLIMADCEMTPNNYSQNDMVVNSVAPLYGASYVTNTIFEGSAREAVKLIGTTTDRVRLFYFTNCHFNQPAGFVSVAITWALGIFFENCYMGGSKGVEIGAGGTVQHLSLHQCYIDTTAAAVGTNSALGSINTLNISNCTYVGTTYVVDLSLFASGNIANVNVSGGWYANAIAVSNLPAAANPQLSVIQSGAWALKGNPLSGADITLGDRVATSTATPRRINMGATFSNTSGSNPKLVLYDDGSAVYGLGVAAGGFLDYIPGATGVHRWWSGGVSRGQLVAAGRWFLGTGAGDDGIHDVQVPGKFLAGALHRAVVTKTANYTCTGVEGIVYVDASGGSVTITLAAANAAGSAQSASLRIKRTDSSANTVTVQRGGADTLDGGTTTTIAALGSKDFDSDGSTKWFIS